MHRIDKKVHLTIMQGIVKQVYKSDVASVKRMSENHGRNKTTVPTERTRLQVAGIEV